MMNYYSLEPTHIYISHLHWDHYHGPSLRLFEKYDPLILLPKHFNNRMKGDFKKFLNSPISLKYHMARNIKSIQIFI